MLQLSLGFVLPKAGFGFVLPKFYLGPGLGLELGMEQNLGHALSPFGFVLPKPYAHRGRLDLVRQAVSELPYQVKNLYTY